MSQGAVAAVLGFGSTERSLPTFQLGIPFQACLRAGRGISQSKERRETAGNWEGETMTPPPVPLNLEHVARKVAQLLCLSWLPTKWRSWQLLFLWVVVGSSELTLLKCLDQYLLHGTTTCMSWKETRLPTSTHTSSLPSGKQARGRRRGGGEAQRSARTQNRVGGNT